MRSNLIAGLDIGTTKTCAVIAELDGDDWRHPQIKILGAGQARTSGIRREIVSDLEETTQAVRNVMKEAELMAGVTVDRVYAGIAGDHVCTRSSLGVVALQDEEITVDDLARVHEVARAVALPPDREMLHAIPQEYVVDHQPGIKDPLGMTGTRLECEVYLVTCASQPASNIRKVVQRAGYRVQELVLEPLAASLAVLNEDEKEVGVALVDLGAGSTDVGVFYEGRIRHIATIRWGGTTLTTDLVRGLSMPFAEAQRAKERFGAASTKLVNHRETVDLGGNGPGSQQRRAVARELIAHVLEERLDEIFGLVRREIDALDLPGPLGAGVVLTGGGAGLEGLVEFGQHVFSAPVRIGVPMNGLTGLADSLARPKFATVAGLVTYAAERFVETGAGTSTLASGLVSRVGSWLKEFF
ncbi:MAG: cell division protein FtsA [Gemmatimonadetes bacterium]|nr:cell division protein FtsA [Gemmatimonadota bacterium]